MIGIKRHSLDQRLEWVDAHYAAHPEFVAHSIYSMVDSPIPVYLSSYDSAQAAISALLGISPSKLENMTYGDVVRRTRGESAVMKAKVARLLALPLLYTNQLNEERMAMYAKR